MNLQETNVSLQRSIQSEEDRISRYDWRTDLGTDRLLD
jgi:hypothetical protein